jgi:dihydropteroate synthase
VDATPWVRLPEGAGSGVGGAAPAPLRIGRTTFVWGERTYVMGIVNVTPDSFSGDGLLGSDAPTSPGDGRGTRVSNVVDAAVELARRHAAEGADILDIGGESTRPGHETVTVDEERRRVVPVVEAIRAVLPDAVLSIDTTKAEVALAALDAGADMINDVWGVAAEEGLLAVAADRGVSIILMHNRTEARYGNVLGEVIADLERAVERAASAGVDRASVIVDPGIGFGKTPEQSLAVLRDLATLRVLGRPVLVGASRKSTIGRVLDLPAEQRLEGTLATTALAVASGADIVRVHDVEANVRAARMADAVVRAVPAHLRTPEGR